MTRNGRADGELEESTEELRRQAALRREAVKRTAAALEERLRERSEQISELLSQARERVHGVERAVHKYRYVFVGGAIGVGFAMARRRRPLALPPADDRVRYVLLERRPARSARSGLLRTLVGGAGSLALRHGFDWLARQFEESSESDEPR